MGFPPALDIDLLRSFVLIAERGSFTHAAESVGRSQPALSLQMKRLEALVGRQLFVRGKGESPQLTPQGRQFLDRARELVALNDSIMRSLPGEPMSEKLPAERRLLLSDFAL